MEAAQNIEQIRQDQDRLAAQTATAPVDQNPSSPPDSRRSPKPSPGRMAAAVREERNQRDGRDRGGDDPTGADAGATVRGTASAA